MTDIERMQKDIRLLELCIENSPGKIMPDCSTPEIKELFDEITRGVPMDWKEVRWWALEHTFVSAMKTQIQLMQEEIAKQERILKRQECPENYIEAAEDPAAWSKYEQLDITSYYAKRANASPVETTKPKHRRKSKGPVFDDIVIDEEAPKDKKTTTKTPEDFAPTFDDIGW